jgi:hypothetical protein
MTALTQERLKELLHYDPETGVFTWIGTKARRIANGDEAGSVRERYRIINIDYKPTGAHRLAWLYVYGYAPSLIDHKDGDGLNNSITNLRECTDTQNKQNSKRPAHNKTGFKGVSWHSARQAFRATINVRRKQIHLGFFSSAQDAHDAYVAKARELFGEFARAA